MRRRSTEIVSEHADVFRRWDVCGWHGCNKAAHWDVVPHVGKDRREVPLCTPHARAVVASLKKTAAQQQQQASALPEQAVES